MFLHYHLSRTYLFQSTYLYKVRHLNLIKVRLCSCFNPRTYIRYDYHTLRLNLTKYKFQSTYLYKVRHINRITHELCLSSFNPRTYIRYDLIHWLIPQYVKVFQSTYLYKVRRTSIQCLCYRYGFNPRTYIRYDYRPTTTPAPTAVSIHVPI